MSELLHLSVSQEAPHTEVVSVVGEIDLSTCDQLAEALEGLNGCQVVVVDLTSCTFIDSSGLGVLVRYATGAAKRNKQLRVRVDERTRRIFDITNLGEKLRVEDA